MGLSGGARQQQQGARPCWGLVTQGACVRQHAHGALGPCRYEPFLPIGVRQACCTAARTAPLGAAPVGGDLV